MRESALTAGVDVTLPVIAQGWFCSGCLWRLLRFPKRESVVGNPGVAASSENGLAWRDCDQASAIRMRLHFGADALLLLRAGLEGTLQNVSGGLALKRGLGQP
jgi:hypothetical protein